MVRNKTKVWNRTDAKIEVKEGNGGIFNFSTPLARNHSHEVCIESDTTYRTFKVLRMGDTMNNAHYVDLDSDYLTDNKIVYIRINENGKCYKDGIPRDAKQVTKEIVNNTTETIVIKETADLPHHTGRPTLLKELRPGESIAVEAIDEHNQTRTLRYSVELAAKSSQGTTVCSREITAYDFNSNVVEIYTAAVEGALHEKKLIVGQRRLHEPRQKSFRKPMSLWGLIGLNKLA